MPKFRRGRIWGYGKSGDEESKVPYTILGVRGTKFVKVRVNQGEFTPQQISAFILQDLKKTAEDYLGEKGGPRGHHRSGVFQRRAASGD